MTCLNCASVVPLLQSSTLRAKLQQDFRLFIRSKCVGAVLLSFNKAST